MSKLELFDSARHNDVVLVATDPSADDITATVNNQSWDAITFVTVHNDNDDLLECSGSYEDGFSARYVESSKEFFSVNPPNSTEAMIALLQSFHAADDSWRSLIEWASV